MQILSRTLPIKKCINIGLLPITMEHTLKQSQSLNQPTNAVMDTSLAASVSKKKWVNVTNRNQERWK